jgi:N-acylglucosamine 2-epimerase
MTADFAKLAKLYRDTLLNDVIPFWEKHSIDWEVGGYLTCMDRAGNVFDTDKFMWMQCRQVWTFSMLYNEVEKNPQWLKIAKNGANFLAKHGMDEGGNWYFSLDRYGRPLVVPYNIYSDCDACIGFSQYAKATGDEKMRQIALNTFRNIMRRKDDPKGKWSKAASGARDLRELGPAVTLIITALDLQWMLDKKELNDTLDMCISEVFEALDPKLNLLYEWTPRKGPRPDCFEGRIILPGHAIEGMWYVMEASRLRGDKKLIDKCVDIILSEIEFGWDKEFGGIYYFMDARGHPPLQLEWDRKLWWVHLESLVSFAIGYLLTGRKEVWKWFEKVHEYTWSHFPDPEFGEWWAYLDRQGKVFIPLKGGKFKCCFHLPRALFKCWRIFTELAK